jgi:hypothetical protein
MYIKPTISPLGGFHATTGAGGVYGSTDFLWFKRVGTHCFWTVAPGPPWQPVIPMRTCVKA